MTPDQFNACGGCVQLPWALSATSVIYNLHGVKNNLHITGPDHRRHLPRQGHELERPEDQEDQPGRQSAFPTSRSRPSTAAIRAVRSFNFTSYLNTVSKQWKSQVGSGTTVNWPEGVGASGSSGVSGVVSRTEGAIGYVDIAYALQNHLKFSAVQNRSKQFARPGLVGIKAASLADRKFSPTNALSIVNPPPGKKLRKAYPICTYTYVILRIAVQSRQRC